MSECILLGVLAACVLLPGCFPAKPHPSAESAVKLTATRPAAATEPAAQALLLHQQGHDREALPLAKRALASTEQLVRVEPLHAAQIFYDLAPIFECTDDPVRAEELYLHALAIRETTQGRDHSDVGDVLAALANLYHVHGEYPRADELYHRVLAIREKVAGPDHPDTATALNQLGRLYQDQHDYTRAKECYERALAIEEKAPAAVGRSGTTSLSNIAALEYDRGDYERAAQFYRQVLATLEARTGAAETDLAAASANAALVEQKLGNYALAEQLYRRALAIDERTLGPEHPDVATVSNNLASLLQSRGDYAQANHLYERALTIRQKALGSDHAQVATILNNLAGLAQSLGDDARARDLYERALAIRENTLGAEHPEVAATLNNLASVAESAHDFNRAEELYERARSIYRRTLGAHHPDTETVTGNIANVLLRSGRLAEAYPILKEGDWPAGLGSYFLAKHDYHNAHKQFLRAIERADPKGESRHLIPSYLGLGLSLEALGQTALAARSYEAAVGLLEEQRAALGPSQRIHFLSGSAGAGFTRILAYEGLVSTSAAIGDTSRALHWAEHTKARQLLEATVHTRTAPGVPPLLAQQEQELEAHLAALYRQRDDGWAKTPTISSKIDQEDIPQAKERLNNLVTQLRQECPAYAAYKYPQPLATEHMALRPREALLEFAVTEDKTFAWLLRHGNLSLHVIPITRSALEQQIHDYRSLFQDIRSTQDLRPDANLGQQLFRLLVKDALTRVAPGDTLIIVPDGSLGLLPFEALVMDDAGAAPTPSAPRYLGDSFPILYAQSATVLSNARTLADRDSARDDRDLFILADPVFDERDQRWPAASAPAEGAEAGPNAHGRLRWRRLEKTESLIGSLQDSFGAKRVHALRGEDASEARLRAQPLHDYRHLVFATHGLLGGQIPYVQEPALVLTQIDSDGARQDNDGYLTLSEVLALNLNADVAALTACETGVGAELTGEGVLGMGWAFQYAGARNVAMSLWRVDQEAAVILMGEFFANLKKGVGPQDALREARTSLRAAGYSHPFFWAPFILVGEG